MGHDATGGFVVTEDGNGMARAAKFEGPGVLKVFTFQKKFAPGLLRQHRTGQHRSAVHYAIKALPCLGNHFGSWNSASIHHSSPNCKGGPSSA